MTETTFKVGDKATHESFGKGEITYGPFTNPAHGSRYLLKDADGNEYAVRGLYLTAAPTFEVGDKVRDGGDEYIIKAGPFKGYSEWYAVADAEGRELQANADTLTAVPAPEPVKVGDRVRVVLAKHAEEYHGKAGTVTSVSGTWAPDGELHAYRVRVDGVGALDVAKVEKLPADGVAPEPVKVGDRIRVTVDGANLAMVSKGDVFTVDRLTERGIRTTSTPRRSTGWFFTPENFEKITDADTFTEDGVTYDLTAQYRDKDGDRWDFSADLLGSDGTPRARMNSDAPFDDDLCTLRYVTNNYSPLRMV